MRITNPMVTNRMLLNINRNARNVDKLYNQLATGKQIIFPSDDPILAGRAIKFRTSVTETEQYQRNTSQGLSWMEITEGAFRNVTNITGRIRELLVQGASDENAFSDRQKITADIEQLVKQLGAEMNVSYAGRYVFSGYRTDQPPTIQKDDPTALFQINQSFTAADIEKIDVLQSEKNAGASYNEFSLLQGIDVVKLAYSDGIVANTVGDSKLGIGFGNPVVWGTLTSDQVFKSLNDDGKTTPPADPVPPDFSKLSGDDADKIFYIKDTGTLVLGANVALAMRTDGAKLEASYTKEGLEKGDLNPIVYFECTDLNDIVDNPAGKSYNMNEQTMEYEFGTMTRIKVNSLAKDVYTDKFYADLVDFCNVFTSTPVNTLDAITEALRAAGGLTEDQITAQAKDIYDTEQDQLRKMSQQRFDSMLGQIDSHNAIVMREQTDLGSRMSRLELIETRLEEDRVSYKKLLSDNEDVDYTEAAMEMSLAESVYQAALQVGAKVMQISLADYIR